MAVSPTEALAADVGSLRESDRHLAAEIATLTTGVNNLRTEFAEFKGEVKRDLRWILLIGGGLVAALAFGVKKGFDLSYQAGELTNQVATNAVQVKERFDQLKERMDKHEAKVDQQLAMIIQRLDQAAATKPKP